MNIIVISINGTQPLAMPLVAFKIGRVIITNIDGAGIFQ